MNVLTEDDYDNPAPGVNPLTVGDPNVSSTDNLAYFKVLFLYPVDAEIDQRSNVPWKGLTTFLYLIIETHHFYEGVFLQELIRIAFLFFKEDRNEPDVYFWLLMKWEKYSLDNAHQIATATILFKHFFPDNGPEYTDDKTDENYWTIPTLKSAYDLACKEDKIVGTYDHIFLVAERGFEDCCPGTWVTLYAEIRKLESHEVRLVRSIVFLHLNRGMHWRLKEKTDVVSEPPQSSEPSSPSSRSSKKEIACARCPRKITPRRKIQKYTDAEPTQLEKTVAQTLFTLENTSQELKSDLKDLFFNAAVDIDISGNRKAVVIKVPWSLRQNFRKIHSHLVGELEKIFSGNDIVMITTPPPDEGSTSQQPHYKAMLEDIVYPAEIVEDEPMIFKIYLDPKYGIDLKDKLKMFSEVFKDLSGKHVEFKLSEDGF